MISGNLRLGQTEQLRKSIVQLGQAQADCRTSRDHDDVDGGRELPAMLAEPFADPPFESIALDGGSRFAAHGDPESAHHSLRGTGSVAARRNDSHRRCHNDQLWQRSPPPTPEHPLEISSIQEPIGWPETARPRRPVIRLPGRHAAVTPTWTRSRRRFVCDLWRVGR